MDVDNVDMEGLAESQNNVSMSSGSRRASVGNQNPPRVAMGGSSGSSGGKRRSHGRQYVPEMSQAAITQITQQYGQVVTINKRIFVEALV